MVNIKIYDQNQEQKKEQNSDNASFISTKNTRYSQEQSSTKKEDQIMLFQIFPSTNLFFCAGRLIQGQYPRPFIFAILLIVIPVILHIVFRLEYGYYQAIFTALTFFFMFKTAFSDPGIIPRADNLVKDQQIQDIPIDRTNQKPLGYLLVDRNGQSMSYKICDTCGIFKDKDRRHCRVCDNCVNGFDHHCIWLNNCIGRNNYQSFIFFLFFLTIQLVFTIVSCACYLNEEIQLRMDRNDEERGESTKNVLRKQPLPIFLIIYSSFFILLVGTLFFYHIYLILKDTSTVEQKKQFKIFQQQQNYIQTSCWYSFKKKFLCIKSHSYINFRQFLEEKIQKKIHPVINKDSESATQVAAAGQIHVKNEENRPDFLSNNIQHICINVQIEKTIEIQNCINQQNFQKEGHIQESKEDLFQTNDQNQKNNFNKKRSLQLSFGKDQDSNEQDLQKSSNKSINL